jgi:ABC-type branched-subunit amino acid transport system substrate-binding protein
MKRSAVFVLIFFISVLLHTRVVAQATKDQLKQMRSSVVERIDGKEYYIHTIRRGQTLYMISKAYGVEVNDIIRENPLVKDGIRADEKIRILVPGQKNPAPPAEKKSGKEAATLPAGAAVKKDSAIVVELPCGTDTAALKPVYRVALMLPLSLGEVEQINTEKPDPAIFETTKSFKFLPYYEGFRMALDSLKKGGLKIKLYVYDVGRDTAKTRQLLRKPELKSMDLIFGLLYQSNFQIVAAFAKKNKITLVNPISERSDVVANNPFVFKVQPPRESQYEQLAKYMAGAFRDGQVMIVRNGLFKDREAPDLLKKACLDIGLGVMVVDGQEAAIVRYSRDKPNYVVVFSDNQAHMLDLMRSMYKLRNEFNLTLVGLPGWSVVEGLESEYLVALRTHMMAASFVDYENPLVRKFAGDYQEKYKADPGLLAFQGFDQCYFFLTAMKTYGSNIARCIGELKAPGMVNRFDFTGGKESGYENQSWTICKYDNYRVVPVN